MDEQELLKRIQAGDEEAFEAFYQATNKLVYFHLKKYLSHEEDVWEVLQDVYLAVYQNAGRLADRTKWRSWLGGITRNLALKKATRHVPPPTLSTDDEERPIDLMDELHLDPAQELEEKETRELVAAMVDRLPEEQRTAVVLFYFDQCSVGEIASAMGCSENTVKSRLHYGRKALRRQTEELEGRGVKLYSLTPALLLAALQAQMETLSASASFPALPSLAAGMGAAGTAGAAGAASAAGTAGAAGGAAGAAGAAGTAAGVGIGVKIAAVAAAAVLTVGAATIAARPDSPPAEEPPVTETIAPQPPAAEEPSEEELQLLAARRYIKDLPYEEKEITLQVGERWMPPDLTGGQAGVYSDTVLSGEALREEEGGYLAVSPGTAELRCSLSADRSIWEEKALYLVTVEAPPEEEQPEVPPETPEPATPPETPEPEGPDAGDSAETAVALGIYFSSPTIQLSPGNVYVAIVYAQGGYTLPGDAEIQWTNETPALLSLSASTGRSIQITASRSASTGDVGYVTVSAGGYSARLTVQVVAAEDDVGLSLNAATMEVGDRQSTELYVFSTSKFYGQDYTTAWSCDRPDLLSLTVSADGQSASFTALANGHATVTCTVTAPDGSTARAYCFLHIGVNG